MPIPILKRGMDKNVNKPVVISFPFLCFIFSQWPIENKTIINKSNITGVFKSPYESCPKVSVEQIGCFFKKRIDK